MDSATPPSPFKGRSAPLRVSVLLRVADPSRIADGLPSLSSDAGAALNRPPIIAAMRMPSDLQRLPGAAGTAAVRWGSDWWRVFHFGAQLLALAFSPSTYAPRHRPALARHVYLATAPNLLWFTVL